MILSLAPALLPVSRSPSLNSNPSPESRLQDCGPRLPSISKGMLVLKMISLLLGSMVLRLQMGLLLQGILVQGSEFNLAADNYTVCQGDNVTLSCSIEDPSTKEMKFLATIDNSSCCSIDEQVIKVAWLNRSGILYAGNDKWSIDPRVQLLTRNNTKYSILITHVDVYDEGLYTCSFQTRSRPYTSQVYLIVQVPARIVNISSSVTVNEGSNVNLQCLAVGKPEPNVVWRQVKENFTSEGEYLEITGINRQQAGEYECITINGVSTPDRRRVHITVNYPPTITDAKGAQSEMGKKALLRCDAMAVPPAEFEWFKDDKRLTGGIEGFKIQNKETRSILVFSNVTAQHYGNYTCIASNKLGTSNASMRLYDAYKTGNNNSAVARMETSIALGLLSSAFVTILFKI
ncbi:igLON family member 5 isoform X2 [Microcaecilia unicolor]|uniref:IgLON family member 5 isoform X2 n=1 Tax=Microcaecilia unicolor TaxID=1415580 RepID=A0A6P7YV66_9AMPH|nr:igLON family member 5 isoform X2 [Microcaecilia unicolor]